MKFGRLSIVLSTQASQFKAVALKGALKANLAKIGNWGYEGVELAIRNPDLVDVDQLEEILAVHELKVPAIGTGQAWGEERLSFSSPELAIRKAAIGRIKKQIKLAKRLNALVIIGLIRGVTPPGQAKEQSMRLLADCLCECAGFALAQHVSMAFEPLNQAETDLVHTCREGLELIQQIGLPNLGLLLDTYHMNIEESDIRESILFSGSKIFHFHVADSNRCYPGAGLLDFKTILRALKSTGYSGWISGEFLPTPDADTAAEQCMQHLKQIIIRM